MNKFQDFLNKYRARQESRKARKARRTAESVADTAAAGVGGALRLSLKTVATVLLIILTTAILFVCIFAIYVKTCLTTDLDVSLEEAALALSSTIWYETDDGEWKELATLYQDANREWVEYEDIPIHLQHAAVAIEDKRFYEHKGVDWYRTTGAFFNMFLGMKDRFGGSTITQQLIKNLTTEDDITVQRKLLEIFRALEFEKIYTKTEIMTWYLNYIYLGQGCYGVSTAAQAYFGKDVTELSLAECASLIGITNNPSLYNPYEFEENNKTRQEAILWQMYDQGYITHDEYVAAVAEPLEFKSSLDDDRDTTVYSYYVDTVIRDVIEDLAEAKGCSLETAEHLLYNGGYNVYTCIDMDIQNIVDNYYENPYNFPSPYRSASQPLQSAMVIIDPYTGDVVALVGGIGEKTSSLSGNHADLYPHPPGSSLKPLSVYAPAIDLGIVTQRDYILDSPNLRLSGTSWFPKNSGNTYSGSITIHDALVYSKNTVAAQLLDTIGLQTSYEYLTDRFALTTLVTDQIDEDTGRTITDIAYSPLSLGQLSYGVTVREMAQAYTAFVNDGVLSKSRTYSLITDDDGNVVLENPVEQYVVIKANTAWNITDMLQDAVSYGTGTAANFGSTAIAGKTGTTGDDYDRYFVGYTMYYVAAVWTGHESSEAMYYRTNPACQIFRSIMGDVHYGLSWWSFPSATIGSATNIYDAAPTPSPSPSPTPSPSPSASPSPSPSPTAPPATDAPATSTPKVTEQPVTPTKAPPTPTQAPTAPPPTQAPTEAPPTPTQAPTAPPPTPTQAPTEPPPTQAPTAPPPTEAPPTAPPPTEVPVTDVPAAEIEPAGDPEPESDPADNAEPAALSSGDEEDAEIPVGPTDG